MTPLRLVIVSTSDSLRVTWRLETAHGNHATVVESGSSYMTRASALAGAKRFVASYFREDVVVNGLRKS